ncbi:MAG: protein kinase, partial [Deltaproteobacteria bacterium]|nr:protein kinase [Deltaproteobacteria bacterium]
MSERNGTADPFQLSGTTIAGKYSVGQVVGSGGFGVVYRGLHEGFGEPIAIKCLHVAEHLNASQRGDLLDRLQDEGRVLHRLSKLTAGIVQALDVGAVAAPSGQWVPYLVLEWIEGETLAEHMEARGARNEKGMGLHDAVELLEPAARALAIAHRQKVAHRDVKPENLCLTEVSGQRTVKILDFGIAKVLASHTEFTAAPAATERRTSVFTPRYGAPEQFNKKRGATGPWTDVFALALILVEVASGRRALDGDDA